MKFCDRLMVLGLSLVISSGAWAYIPPANFIFDRMMKSREGLKSLELTAEIKDLRNQSVFQEILRFDFLGGRYSWVLNESPSSSSGALLGSHSGRLMELKDPARTWLILGYDPNTSRVREVVQRLFPFSETQLIRSENHVRWGWGGAAQILIEKDLFVWAGTSLPNRTKVVVRDQARFPRVILIKAQENDRFIYTLRQFKINFSSKWSPAPAVALQGESAESAREWVELVR